MTRIRILMILTGVAVFLVLVGGWFMVVSPKRAALADARTARTQAEAQATTLHGQIALLEQQAADLPAQRARLAAFAVKMPASAGLPSLVRSLAKTAASTGATVVTITPSPPMLPGAAGAAAAAAPGAPVATGSAAYLLVPISLVVEGSYADLTRFLSAAEDLPRALRVTSVSMSRPSTGSSATRPLLQAALTVDAYVAGGTAPVQTPIPSTAADAAGPS